MDWKPEKAVQAKKEKKKKESMTDNKCCGSEYVMATSVRPLTDKLYPKKRSWTDMLYQVYPEDLDSFHIQG
jgi:hypothetical protein